MNGPDLALKTAREAACGGSIGSRGHIGPCIRRRPSAVAWKSLDAGGFQEMVVPRMNAEAADAKRRAVLKGRDPAVPERGGDTAAGWSRCPGFRIAGARLGSRPQHGFPVGRAAGT